MSQDPQMLALTISATDLVQTVGSEAAASALNKSVVVDGAADKTVDVSGSKLLIAKESESVSAATAVTVAVTTTAATEPASTAAAAAANDLELNLAQVCICYAFCVCVKLYCTYIIYSEYFLFNLSCLACIILFYIQQNMLYICALV